MPTTTATDQRSYAKGSASLELSGTPAGQLVAIAGGDATADVVKEILGSDPVVHKQLGTVRYTDIELKCSAVMDRIFLDWIQDTLIHKFATKNGAISFLDYDDEERSRLVFSNALLTSVGFPALDASAKERATMTVRLSPEHTRREPGAGKRKSGQVASNGQKRDQWTPANFRLQIDGLDCTGVTKIEPVTVTAVVAEEPSGKYLDSERSVGHLAVSDLVGHLEVSDLVVHLEVSDLVVTVAENKAATFHAWHDDFVIKGKNGSQYEKNGTLEFLSSNMQDVLLTLQLRNLGIFKLASAEATSSEAIPRVTASMYCEEITLGTSIPPPKGNGGQGNGDGGPNVQPIRLRTGSGEFPQTARGLTAPVDVLNDPRNCGAVGNDITNLFPNAVALCVNGQPRMGECLPGYVDADGIAANGCELYTVDGVATHPTVATELGTVFPGLTVSRLGVRGPTKPAWYAVTMPCDDDSCTARIQMMNGPAFDVFGSTFQTTPLATGVTTFDVPLSRTLTRLYVNVPAGPWASYNLVFSRQ